MPAVNFVSDGLHRDAAPDGVTTRITFGRAEVFCNRLLTGEEAEAVTAALLLMPQPLRGECWTSGEDGITTIGAPLYRHRDRRAYYAERARATNAALYGYFRDLHERIAMLFERRYGVPVVFVDELAIPGFHLFEYARDGRVDGGAWHFDQMVSQVPYFGRRPGDVAGILNFTLALAVPSGGTGMDLFDDEPGPAPPGSGVRAHIPYRPGVVLFTEREYWHRIGPSTCRAGDRRLTLQGHGVRLRSEGLLLFW